MSATRRAVAGLSLVTLGALASCASPAGAPSPAASPAPRTPTERETFVAAVDSLVRAPAFRNAHWGVLVVDPAAGDTIYSVNAGKLFMPASNQKILTGAVALAQLGPDYRYRTRVLSRALPRADGTLDGDLVVVGRGDPTVSDHMRGDATLPLRALADSLAARGVKRVTGSVIRGGDAFSDSPLGFGWDWDDLPAAYGAGVDELMLNEGFTRVTVRGGAAAGAPVTVVRTAPARGYPSVTVDARTVAARGAPGGGSASRAAIEATWRTALTTGISLGALRPEGVLVSGEIPAGDTASAEVAYPDAGAAYLVALVEALQARGIAVARGADATARIVAGDSLAALTEVAHLDSPPLREILPAMEKPSQNQIAEALFKTIALERTGVGRADSARRVVERQLAAWGAGQDGFAVRDGSGLSRHDYVSPETIVRVLDAMRRDTSFQVFYAALPIAGVDGTIGSRMRGTPAQGNVHAKTGYVDKARSLSGYVTTADGRLLVFSLLCNNWSTPVDEVERVQDAIAVRLASLRLGAR